jgi:DNA polymerase I-like protein with 3'-5' exonuclease and polymerase domains
LSDFFAKNITVKTNLTKLSKMTDPLLHDDPNPEVIIVLDSPESGKQLEKIVTFFRKNLNVPFRIISALQYSIVSDDEIKSVLKTYKKDCVDLKKYIPVNSKVLSINRSIYAITKSGDIGVDSFTDIVFSDTYFYAPEYKSFIFPSYSLDKVIGQKTWERHHMMHQCEKILKFTPVMQRVANLKLSIIEKNDIDAFFAFHKDDVTVAIDTETAGFNFVHDRIGCVTLAFNGVEGFFLRWDELVENGIAKFSEFIKPKFQVYANGKFDLKMFLSKGVDRDSLHIDFDTYQAGHLLNEMRKNGLKAHAWIYTNYGGYDSELDEYIEKWSIKSYLKIPEEILRVYATKDAIITFQVYEKMAKQIEKIDKKYPAANGWSLSRYYYDIMLPADNMFVDIEYTGVYVNTQKLEEEGIELQKRIDVVKDEFYKLVGKNKDNFNINSGDELGRLLEERGLPEIERGKKGIYLSNDDILKKYDAMGYKEGNILSRYRTLSTIQKTFVGLKGSDSGFWQYLRYHDDGTVRAHSSFGCMIADSGRTTSRDPNMQNNLAHGDLVEFVRQHFATPDDNYVFMSADYSGLQMRLATIVSKDVELTDVFINQAGDVHSKTTVSILLGNRVTLEDFLKVKKEKQKHYQIIEFGKERKLICKDTEGMQYREWKVLSEFIPDDMRFKSKGVNFGLLFGKGATSVMTMDIMPNWTKKQCEQYIHDNNIEMRKLNNKYDVFYTVAHDVRTKFFETYFGLQQWHDTMKAFATKHGYVRSIYGAFRRLPELLAKDESEQGKKREGSLLNISLNTTIQNCEAVVVLRTMTQLHNFIKENKLKSKLFAVIHDAIELYVHRDEILLIRDKLIEYAQFPHEEYNGIPLEVEGNIADPLLNEVWDSGKDWKKHY